MVDASGDGLEYVAGDVERVAVRWRFRGLFLRQRRALEQLLPRLDAARALDDARNAEMLSNEIEWRRQLLEVCEQCVPVQHSELSLICSGPQDWLLAHVPKLDKAFGHIFARCCTVPHLRRFYSCYLAHRGVTTWQHVKALHYGSASLACVPDGLVTYLLDRIQQLECEFGAELAELAPSGLLRTQPPVRSSYSNSWVLAAPRWFTDTVREACGIATGRRPGTRLVDLCDHARIKKVQ
eukprot:TRINITY_DN16738_c0_g1_i1.p1 TRINITY_DN16738_c0_g1~~TRINITY_DN16738_c0_g1_i1.p1  ORF type:complete len:238 (-),score=9.11 TRINITY_DN16738_c0_g1_i1:157-870(-)